MERVGRDTGAAGRRRDRSGGRRRPSPTTAASPSFDEREGARSIKRSTRFGGLDILINNAGILRDKMSFNMDEAEWDAVIDVHMKGHFCTSQACRRVLAGEGEGDRRAGGGGDRQHDERVRACTATPARSNYAAAKAGIASMTIVMARELERSGVRVNCHRARGAHPSDRGARAAST